MESIVRFLSRIWIRLLAFNVLLIFLPAIAILTFRTYEDKLLDQQERSMVQQGRILAAALGEQGTLEDAAAERILVNMRRQFDARLRVLDPDLVVLADSSLLGPRSAEVEPTPEADEPEARERWVYRLGSFLYRLYARLLLPPEPPAPDSERDATVEEVRTRVVRDALEGRYRAGTAVSSEVRSLTLYSAIPIRDGEAVVGVALVSKSTFQILRALYDLRLTTFRVVLASVVAAVVLSLLLATTIAHPIHRLRRQARAILDRRGRLRGRFKGLRRRDEIGDLSRALAELTRRLEGHLRFIESFASDVSHEFKNPLAAIRNATELLAEVEDPAERQRFIAMVLGDIARLEHLLARVGEITHLDATLEERPAEAVELVPMLRAFVERYEMQPATAVRYRLAGDGDDLRVAIDPERLAQVFENLLDNAASFSPADGEVRIDVATDDRQAVVTVRDQGPGIPDEHLELIFTRFFSYRANGGDPGRPDGSGNGRPDPGRPDPGRPDPGHTGLGLAIVKTIVEGYGGAVAAWNADDGGAVFEVRLPLG